MKTTLGKIMLITSLSTLAFNAYAEWECYSVDQAGHYWSSTGSTQERATNVAISFCSAYSPNSSSCQPSKCLMK